MQNDMEEPMRTLISKIVTVTTAFVFIALLTQCRTGIRYISQNESRIRVPASSQPLYLVITDGRADKTPRIPPAETISSSQTGAYDLKKEVETNPDLTVRAIFLDLFTKNHIVVTETDRSHPFEIVIELYTLDRLDTNWKSSVRLVVSNGNYQQTISTTYERPDLLGKRDGEKTLSQALSAAIDKIDWDKQFPH